jgi:hypothetical protein
VVTPFCYSCLYECLCIFNFTTSAFILLWETNEVYNAPLPMTLYICPYSVYTLIYISRNKTSHSEDFAFIPEGTFLISTFCYREFAPDSRRECSPRSSVYGTHNRMCTHLFFYLLLRMTVMNFNEQLII